MGENRGYAAGCNAGIGEAKGDSVLVLSDDVELLEGSVEAMLTKMKSDPAMGVVGPVLVSPDGKEEKSLWCFPDSIRHLLFLPPAYGYVAGAAFLVKREVFERVGLLDEDYYLFFEEVDFCLRAVRTGYRIAVAEEAKVMDYPNRRGWKIEANRVWRMERSRIMFFLKNYSFAQLLFRPLVDIASLGHNALKFLLSLDGPYLFALVFRPLAYAYFLVRPLLVIRLVSRNRRFFSLSF